MFSPGLQELYRQSLNRVIKDRSSPQNSKIFIDGRELINFASNDYLGLASHPEVVEAATESMKNFGFGSGASRLLGGGSILHRGLEDKIARFKGTEAALLFNAGYAANTGIIPALAGEGTVLFSDELNHAGVVDGCRLSKAETVVYRHGDVGHLSELIAQQRGKRMIVATDTVFSMDGDIAPIKEMHRLFSSMNSEPVTVNPVLLYLDDAHGTGVIGNGRGALDYFGIKPEPWIIQMGTFSKALGSFGAFAAGSREVIEWLINNARSFIFSTAIPSCAVAASDKALEMVQREPQLVQKLWKNRRILANALDKIGLDTGRSKTPIIPIRTKNIEEALNLSHFLHEKGFYAPAIRPPTVREPRVRITVTASHSEEEITSLAMALAAFPD